MLTLTQAEEQRFFGKLEVGDCWEWTGYRAPSGHGQLRLRGKGVLAHRLAYQVLVGNIPPGLQLDHLCRNPPCCNPDHLEPVTQQENIRRGYAGIISGAQQRAKTHCPKGHPYSGDNLFVRSDDCSRECRTCMRARDARRRNQEASSRD